MSAKKLTYSTKDLIEAAVRDPWAREALYATHGEDPDAALTEGHIAAACDYCADKARESVSNSGELNLFGEYSPDRSSEWMAAADEILYVSTTLGIRPPADYP